MIRKKPIGVWYKKFIWHPFFFNTANHVIFVWCDFVDVRHFYDSDWKVITQYRLVKDDPQCV